MIDYEEVWCIHNTHTLYALLVHVLQSTLCMVVSYYYLFILLVRQYGSSVSVRSGSADLISL